MRSLRLVRAILQSILFPQACCLCEQSVLNVDLLPLCETCFSKLRPLESPICDICGVPVPGNILADGYPCSRCRKEEIPFDRARAWGGYDGALRELIRQYKFRNLRTLVKPLGSLLHTAYLSSFAGAEINSIIPVPLHPKRKRSRGFDQTQHLARELSRLAGIPLIRPVRRVKHTQPQFGLDLKARRLNVSGAFSIDRPILPGGNVLIVDDVMTSGATAGEVASQLKSLAQVRGVFVLTVARVPLAY